MNHRARVISFILVFGVALVLAGCGFSIRGANVEFPFKSISIDGNHGVAQELLFLLSAQRNLSVNPKRPDTQVKITVVSQVLERQIVSFNASGRPREISLRMRVNFRAVDQYGVELIPQSEINQTRDLSINESEILANPASEGLLNEDMQKDIAWQIVRRLRSVKLPG